MTTNVAEKKKGAGHHTLYIVLAIVGAFVFAWLWPKTAASLEVGGKIFLSLLMMVVVPLVMSSVMSGILGLGDVRKLGKPGAAAVGYYMSTTLLAVLTGVLMFNLVNPGANMNAESVKQRLEEKSKDLEHEMGVVQETKKEGASIGALAEKLLLMLVTDNLLESMVNMKLLPLIVFSIVFAGMLTTLGKRSQAIGDLVVSANDALLEFILLLIKVAPLGIFCMVTAKFGAAFAKGTFVEEMTQLAKYMTTVLGGLGIHFLVTLPLILWITTKRNPYLFMKQMFDALMMAFSTASSAATLPVTMECAEQNAKVSRRSIDFVLPLGATINMDGTALYEAAAALFIANVYALTPEAAAAGFELTPMVQVTIAITATLAAIGAAGIPEAGLVTMTIVLTAVGLPVEYLALILPIDWFLDRFRTMINAFGDSVGAAIVEKTFSNNAITTDQ